jgi:hypothetical protein
MRLIHILCSLILVHVVRSSRDVCNSYRHPQYGPGRCIDRNRCAKGSSLTGLCESNPSDVQCCFVEKEPELEEFRAAWIATVENIDWPSSRNGSADINQGEIIKILDMAQKLNMNAVIFQVGDERFAIHLSCSPLRFDRLAMLFMLQHWNRGVFI